MSLVGPDIVFFDPIVYKANARKRASVRHAPEELYAGKASYLVRTALVRAPDYDSSKRVAIRGPEDIAFLCSHLAHADQEHIVALSLDSGSKLLAIHEAAIGGSSSAEIHLRHVLKVGFLTSAAAVAIVHNHPGGSCRPSDEDQKVTSAVGGGCECVGFTLVDHVIVANDGWYSFTMGSRSSW